MNTLARICWITAPVYALLGMAFGIYMSAQGDHTLSPAHGHLNLLGWVSIAIYGTFYTLVPAASQSRLAKLQVFLAQIGVIALVPGIVMAISGSGEGLAKISSLVLLVSIALFLAVVLRTTRTAAD